MSLMGASIQVRDQCTTGTTTGACLSWYRYTMYCLLYMPTIILITLYVIRECHPVLKGNFEVDYVLYVTMHGEYHRIEENEYC